MGASHTPRFVFFLIFEEGPTWEHPSERIRDLTYPSQRQSAELRQSLARYAAVHYRGRGKVKLSPVHHLKVSDPDVSVVEASECEYLYIVQVEGRLRVLGCFASHLCFPFPRYTGRR